MDLQVEGQPRIEVVVAIEVAVAIAPAVIFVPALLPTYFMWSSAVYTVNTVGERCDSSPIASSLGSRGVDEECT